MGYQSGSRDSFQKSIAWIFRVEKNKINYSSTAVNQSTVLLRYTASPIGLHVGYNKAPTYLERIGLEKWIKKIENRKKKSNTSLSKVSRIYCNTLVVFMKSNVMISNRLPVAVEQRWGSTSRLTIKLQKREEPLQQPGRVRTGNGRLQLQSQAVWSYIKHFRLSYKKKIYI